ncbi:MAG: 2-dehydropantoate 2-reductase, partial [Promethearchaeota archaeon]
MEIKIIWICGIGGVGGYFGGRIAETISKSGIENYKIYFLARGSHLKEINRIGLRLHISTGEKLVCKPTLASDDIEDFPVPDLCIICVKSYDLDNLIINIKDKLAENTVIIPLMNGIDIYDRIRKNLKKCIVLPSCVYLGSHIEKPGLIIQTGNPGFFHCGPDPKFPKFNSHAILEFFKEMEIEVYWEENPYLTIWKKYILVASFALVSAHTNQTMGEIINDPDSRTILEKIMEEIIMIAHRKGINLPDNIIEDTIEFCK